MIKIAETVGLDLIGENSKQQMAGQMRGWLSSKHTLPSRAEALEVKTAQMRDLVLKGYGRDATISSFLSHRIRPPVLSGR